MAWLPGIEKSLKPTVTTPEYGFIIFWDYMQILLFTVILIFVSANIWQILIL